MSASGLFGFLKSVGSNLMVGWNFIRHGYEQIKNFFDHLLTLFSRINTLISSVEEEIQAIKDFEFDPRWKTRVISAPVAYEKIRRLTTEIPSEITSAIKDLVSTVKSRVEAGSGSASEFDAEDLEGDLKLLPESLAKCGEKILGFVTLLFDSVEAISNVVDDLQTLVDDFHEIRDDIEHLDLIFLQNRNPRKYVDGHFRKRERVT